MKKIKTFSFVLREDVKNDKRFIPTRSTKKSAGYDVSCAFDDHNDLIVNPGDVVKIPLGFKCILPEGFWLFLLPRSSSFVKKHMHALYGVIDCDYRHQFFFCAKYEGNEPITLKFGEKIGQIIPFKMNDIVIEEISEKEFDDICTTEENERVGGFGSTDKG